MTEIRASRIRRGAASGGVGAINTPDRPSVQTSVIPRRGIRHSNPMAGATQVGSMINQRLSSMGAEVNQFFQSLAGSANSVADTQHRVELARIERENVEQRQIALNDEISGKPENFRPDLADDRDYFETRLKIRAGNAASEIATEYVTTVLPYQDITSDPSDSLTSYLNEKTKGLTDEAYKSYFLAAAVDKTMPAIEKHYSTLHQGEALAAQDELSTRIQAAYLATDYTRFKQENLLGFIADAQSILPKSMQSNPGSVKAWVLGQAMASYSQSEDHNGMAFFLTQLGSDKELGDGKKTFAQLFPNQYQQLGDLSTKITNRAMDARAASHASQINSLVADLTDITKAADRQETLSALLHIMSDPKGDDYRFHSNVISARKAASTAINKHVGSTSALKAVQAGYNGGALPTSKQVRDAVDNDPAAFLNSQPEGVATMSWLLSTGHELSNSRRHIKSALINRNVLEKDENHSAPAIAGSLGAYTIIDTAVKRHGLSMSDIKAKFGSEGVEFYDAMRDDIARGISPDDAVQNATRRTFSGDFQNSFDNLMKTGLDAQVRKAFGLKQGQTAATAVAKALKKPFDTSGLNIDPLLEDAFMLDVKRDLALSGAAINDDNLKASFERIASRWSSLYAAIPDKDQTNLIHLSRFSSEQLRMVTPRTDADGNQRSGVGEISNMFAALTGEHSFTGNLSNFYKKLTGHDTPPRPPVAPFIKSLLPDDPKVGHANDITSRRLGSLPILNADSGVVMVAPGQSFEFVVNKPAARDSLGLTADETTRLDDRSTLTISSDSEAPELSTDEAWKVIQNGGTIGITQLEDVFNKVYEPLYGFRMVGRAFGDQSVLTLEYNGTVPTQAEIDALRAKREAEFVQPLSFKERMSLALREIEVRPDTDPDEARETLKQSRQASRDYRESIRDQWRNFSVYIWGDPKVTGRSVGQSVIQESTAAANKEADRAKSDEFVQVTQSLIAEAIDQGQVRPSVGVTVLGVIPERIGSAEETISIYKDILQKETRRKGGVPNQRADTPLDDTYVQLRNDLVYAGEGVRQYAYMDTSGVPTIGVGFNLTDPTVMKTVIGLVGKDRYNQMLSDASERGDINKKEALTEAQMDSVFEAVILDKEASVSRWYKNVDLTPVQRAVIVDLAYQGGSRFVGPNTNFYRSVKKGDWSTAIDEVRFRSNRRKVSGIQNRMNHRADMLANTVGQALTDVGSSVAEAATSAFDAIVDAVGIRGAEAGEALAMTDLKPTSEMPVTTQQFSETTEWINSVWKKASESKDVLVQAATDLGADTAAITAMSITPTDSSGMLLSDWILKNGLGIPLHRHTYTEGDIKPINVAVLRDLAKIALSKGRNNITWEDYGTTIVGGVPISGIIGGKLHHQEADKIFPKNPWGYALLGLTTMVDPKVDVALTIGQASLSRDREGNLILTDKYDAQRFLYGSRSDGAYGAMRDFVQGRITSEADDTEVARPIQFRINLGKV